MVSMEWTNRTGHGPEGDVYRWATKEAVVVAADAVAAVAAETMAPAVEIAAGWTVAMNTEARPETWDGGSAHPYVW
jgi:hypothetical protein